MGNPCLHSHKPAFLAGINRMLHRDRRCRFVVLQLAWLLILPPMLTGCAALRIDVDVYKGPLSVHEDAQLEQLMGLVSGSHAVLIRFLTDGNHISTETKNTLKQILRDFEKNPIEYDNNWDEMNSSGLRTNPDFRVDPKFDPEKAQPLFPTTGQNGYQYEPLVTDGSKDGLLGYKDNTTIYDIYEDYQKSNTGNLYLEAMDIRKKEISSADLALKKHRLLGRIVRVANDMLLLPNMQPYLHYSDSPLKKFNIILTDGFKDLFDLRSTKKKENEFEEEAHFRLLQAIANSMLVQAEEIIRRDNYDLRIESDELIAAEFKAFQNIIRDTMQIEYTLVNYNTMRSADELSTFTITEEWANARLPIYKRDDFKSVLDVDDAFISALQFLHAQAILNEQPQRGVHRRQFNNFDATQAQSRKDANPAPTKSPQKPSDIRTTTTVKLNHPLNQGITTATLALEFLSSGTARTLTTSTLRLVNPINHNVNSTATLVFDHPTTASYATTGTLRTVFDASVSTNSTITITGINYPPSWTLTTGTLVLVMPNPRSNSQIVNLDVISQEPKPKTESEQKPNKPSKDLASASARPDYTDDYQQIANAPDPQRIVKIANALKAARAIKASNVYMRSLSSTLRSSLPVTAFQNDPSLRSGNLLLEQAVAPWREAVALLGRPLPSVSSTGLFSIFEADKQNWQNINTVKVNGSGNTNYVVAKDDLGNWYVKNYSADPRDIIESAKNLALFSMSPMAGSNLMADATRFASAQDQNPGTVPNIATTDPPKSFRTQKFQEASKKFLADTFADINSAKAKYMEIKPKVDISLTTETLTPPSIDAIAFSKDDNYSSMTATLQKFMDKFEDYRGEALAKSRNTTANNEDEINTIFNAALSEILKDREKHLAEFQSTIKILGEFSPLKEAAGSDPL